jgi:AcrR family transcriptional regulator
VTTRQRTADERRVQERAVATRAALLDAALDCLVERGYAATTTIEVARRAGVSRGAELHHFSSKAELLTAAVGHLLERRTAEFREAFAEAAPGAVRVDAAIDLLWSMFQGPTFVAWVELWLAARTDPELRTAVVAVDQRFRSESAAIFSEIFPPDAHAHPWFHQLGLAFTYALMDGMALRRLVRGDDQVAPDELVGALKAIGRLVVSRDSPEEKA